MIKFQICGHVGNDPDFIGQAPNIGCRFSVAHTFPAFTTDRGQQIPESTTWLNITCWGQLAKSCREHIHTGDKVFVEGTIRQRAVPQQEGGYKYFTDYEARQVEFMSKRRDAAPAGAASPSGSATPATTSSTATTTPTTQPQQMAMPFPPPPQPMPINWDAYQQ